jgi:dolichol-phosphate mannosyltransferase
MSGRLSQFNEKHNARCALCAVAPQDSVAIREQELLNRLFVSGKALKTANTALGEAARATTLAVVPSYNEATNVRSLIDEVTALPTRLDVLVVDDDSPDGTGDIVRAHPLFGNRVFLLTRTGPRGFAFACRDGFQWSLDHGYLVAVEMDADFSHDPAAIPRLLAEIENGADVALGSRYVDGIRGMNWPVRRLLLSLFAGCYTRLFTGLSLRDPTSGFKAIRSRVLRSLDWDQFAANGYGFIIEFHFLASRKGFQISEVPIVFTERRRGASKMSLQIMVDSARTVLKLACSRVIHPRWVVASQPVESVELA